VMNTTIEINNKPAVTFGQLAAFVDRCRAAGAQDDLVVEAKVSMGGKLTGIKAQVPDAPLRPAEPPTGPSGP
jgi:hypothetical protein